MKSNKYVAAIVSYPGIFSSEECSKIISLFTSSQERVKITEDNTGFLLLENNSENGWIAERLTSLALKANNLTFDFDISSLKEVQITEYYPDSYYDWQVDIISGNTVTRKITMIALLSERSSYEGGNVTFSSNMNSAGPEEAKLFNTSKPEFTEQAGMVFLFPAYRPYKIEPVISGKCYLLQAWMHGHSFS